MSENLCEPCNDCGRPCWYDYDAETYRHAIDPERGCFLIAAETDVPDLGKDQHGHALRLNNPVTGERFCPLCGTVEGEEGAVFEVLR